MNKKIMKSDSREPVADCQKCGFKSGVASISPPKAMYHYFCPSCGFEEQGLAHFIPEAHLSPCKDVILTIHWEENLVSNKELLALKKIDSRFKDKRPLEIKRMVSFRPEWVIGPISGGTGYEIYNKAKELGLKIEIRDVEGT